MSEKFEIPPDLAVFESQLRSMPLAHSQTSRDELLYQSGWAAAMASRNSSNLSKRQSRAWPTATGVFATLATVLAVMLTRHSVDLTGDRDGKTTTAEVAESNPFWDNGSVEDAVGRDIVESFENGPGNRRGVASGEPQLKSDFAERPLSARSRFQELDWKTVPVYETDDEGGSYVKTNVETTADLLRELMPVPESKSDQRSPVRKWFSKIFGEAI